MSPGADPVPGLTNRVAVVGMAGRFPGAPDVERFWENLRDGVESIRVFTPEELQAEGVPPELYRRPEYVAAGGALEGIELFDAGFFNFSPREAALMDPQDRLFLECAWEALEHSGYDPERYRRPIGVFGGELMNTYMMFNLAPHPDLVRANGWLDIRILNDRDFLTTHVSYRLNLRGPSVAVQTACSTSLVAIHLAREALLGYQCDMALAGGVCVQVPHRAGYLYRPGGTMSPDGHCRAFDARAQGMVGGNGVALVVLKRLDDALADGDHVHAVIRGSAINNDGALKVGYTAPSVDAQAEVVVAALEEAEVHPEEISYIEAHGTGTALGDPVEIAALTRAFRAFTEKRGYCAVGSVKTNIGHLDPAAGVAGLIKTVLALEHRQLPPSLHFERPNPEIDFDGSPFFVNARLAEWPSPDGRPRRAGVSSLGIGGTNAHVVLEEAPPPPPPEPSGPWHLLAVSARSPAALGEAERRLAAHLRRHPEIQLADAAATLLAGRRHFAYRRAVLCHGREEAIAALESAAPEQRLAGVAAAARPVVFLFPGQGSQAVGMGRDLYEIVPAFRERFDHCAGVLRGCAGLDLRQALYPPPGEESEAALQQTALAQPALFVVEYCLARLWMSWGVRPAAMIGHSVGELVAACLAEVLSLDDALRLVALRGRLMQELPAGAMLAVALPAAECRELLDEEVSLAAVNAPSLCVLAGPEPAIAALALTLERRGVECRRLHVSHAFHSRMMEPAAAALLAEARRLRLSKPRIPYVSNLTGNWIRAAEATDPPYWARHLRETVRFADGAELLLREGDRLFLEVGPGQTLATLLRRQGGPPPVTLASLPGPQERRSALEAALTALGRLWTLGVEIDGAGLYAGERRRRVPLPTYPFERQRWWVDPPPAAEGGARPAGGWLLSPVWRQSRPPRERAAAGRSLLLADGGPLAPQLAEEIRRRGGEAAVLRFGGAVRQNDPSAYAALAAAAPAFDRLVDLRGTAAPAGDGAAPQARAADLIALAEALAGRSVVPLTVVTAGAADVTGRDGLALGAAARLGVCRRLQTAAPLLPARIVDLAPDGSLGPPEVRRLAAEVASDAAEGVAALRHGRRWILEHEAVPPAEPAGPGAGGGWAILAPGPAGLDGPDLDGLGWALAGELAARADGRLLLVDPRPEEGWSDAARDGRRELERRHPAARVAVRAAEDLPAALDEAAARWGTLAGAVVLTPDGAGAQGPCEALLAALDRRPVGTVLLVSREPAHGELARCLADAAGSQVLAALAGRHRPAPSWCRVRIGGAAGPLAPEEGAAIVREALGAGLEEADVSLSALRRHLRAGGPGASAAPAGAAGREHLSAQYAPPGNELERALCEVWQEVLGVGQVGIHDPFLELGGHSLLAIRVAARCREVLGCDLPTSLLSEAPTVSRLAGALRQRGPAQDRTAPTAEAPAIAPDLARRHEPFPLTDVQQAYWIGRSGAVELGRVSTYAYFEIDSETLDLGRLERAWQRLVERHPMLRAVVQADGRQRILPEVPAYRIEVLDLGGRPPAEVERALAGRRRQLSHEVLPAERGPLFALRASRWRQDGGERTRLHVGIDMLIADAWSFALLERDLGRLYADPACRLPEPELCFRDYVLAEQALREGEAYRRALEYWQSRLDALPAGPDLPLRVQPGSLPEQRFVRRQRRLTSWQGLRREAARRGLSQPALLLSAFSEVLATWSRSPRFSLILTLFNRLPLHPQVDEVVGDFTSLLLLDVHRDVRLAFEERAQQVQQRLWEALEHRHVSGVWVLRELARARGGQAARLPVVFTSTLNFAGAPRQPGTAFGLPGEPVYTISQTPQVWIDHQAAEDAGGNLVWAWDAVEDLFPPGLVDDMFAAYGDLLERLAADEGAWREKSLPLIPARQLAERQAANSVSAAVPQALLHDGILDQARHRPDQVAVVSGDRRLTYGELVRRSTRLAGELRRRGARPDGLVAVVLERSCEEAVAVLGVLQSGAAYLPVDPTYPDEHRRDLLARGEVEIVLTRSSLARALAWPAGLSLLCVDTLAGDAPDDVVPAAVQAGDLAYVIFTSGSTGQPKGVMIEHRAALNTIADFNQRFAVGPLDRGLALSALTFDLSVYDLFGLLGAGGTLVQPVPDEIKEPAHWLELARREGVSLWNSVPALLQMLMDHLESRGGDLPASLRLCFLSGDWLPVDLPRRIRRAGRDVAVVSGGGATEAAIWSVFHLVAEEDAERTSIPYGRPFANQQLHVLDEALEPRPVWVPGDLFIGGLGLARGYWRDEARTRAAFLQHPGGERLYRTGDLARYLPGGDLEFLGREDTQVKVQGYRIELGAVEAALAQHPAVAAAVVAAAGDERSGRRLAAYVVWKEGAAGSPEELRRFLAGKLPPYMVPAHCTVLDALPLSANGKVDRKALPAPDGAERRTAPVPPATPLQETLARCWSEVLGRDSFGVHDNFFEVGGDSLLATRLLARIWETFLLELPLRAVFESSTIAALAERVDELLLQKIEALSDEELQQLA